MGPRVLELPVAEVVVITWRTGTATDAISHHHRVSNVHCKV
jgi:hypothetical protein